MQLELHWSAHICAKRNCRDSGNCFEKGYTDFPVIGLTADHNLSMQRPKSGWKGWLYVANHTNIGRFAHSTLQDARQVRFGDSHLTFFIVRHAIPRIDYPHTFRSPTRRRSQRHCSRRTLAHIIGWRDDLTLPLWCQFLFRRHFGWRLSVFRWLLRAALRGPRTKPLHRVVCSRFSLLWWCHHFGIFRHPYSGPDESVGIHLSECRPSRRCPPEERQLRLLQDLFSFRQSTHYHIKSFLLFHHHGSRRFTRQCSTGQSPPSAQLHGHSDVSPKRPSGVLAYFERRGHFGCRRERSGEQQHGRRRWPCGGCELRSFAQDQNPHFRHAGSFSLPFLFLIWKATHILSFRALRRSPAVYPACCTFPSVPIYLLYCSTSAISVWRPCRCCPGPATPLLLCSLALEVKMFFFYICTNYFG